MKKVLLLNLSEEVLGVISWQDAVKKLCRGIAKRPYGHTEEYKIQTASGIFKLPTAIVLVQYVRIPYKRVILTAENLLKRDNYECQYCGKTLNRKTVTMDHVLPVSRGGKRNWKNIVASCQDCNSKKDNKTPNEAGMTLRLKPQTPSQIIILMSVINKQDFSKSWSRWIAV